jgi:oxidase EvaA
MPKNEIKIEKGSFFESALTIKPENSNNLEDFYHWYNKRLNEGFFEIETIPFDKFSNWSFTANKGEIVHDSGKFFRIEGLRVKTNFGETETWDQPIINQPEIGILGIITKMIDNIRYFLMQTKMEPGNVNILQISPTLQATKSNFTRVHKGKSPMYLEYFVDRSKSKVLIDQLQTEQGARFFKKRNRNMVVEIADDVELQEDFKWLTLGEIKELLKHENIVNMDARSVISTIPLIDENIKYEFQVNHISQKETLIINGLEITGFGLDILKSICETKIQYKSEEGLLSWLTQQKVDYELETEKIPLTELNNWQITEDKIYHSDRFFSVIGVKVSTGTREVTSWTQPLIFDKNIGLLGFITQKIDGILHFLVQAKVEPGNLDKVELCPTVSCSNFDFLMKSGKKIPFIHYFYPDNLKKVHYDAIQSEEGGRFYQMQNRNMIIEIDADETTELPGNYIWMTLNQIMDFTKFGMFNIEARSIISSLKFI